ncbi:CHASE domain-containing protein [Aliikangiella sp. G2MR2-5]|uniref:CHASE domain-containing protein n=1 Tax=Aliikangiella sp. G2MR2-5 TaxID=2788943 RepID=UPI0018A91470|nr:CHASE domain-containing protein [Aliikangiella sp. G2MR2-5]
MNRLNQIAITCLLYYLFGYLGLQLAIPPGFASAVWPASGIALACILKFDKLAASLGIFLGSFIVNIGVSTELASQASLELVLSPLTIAFGSLTQALIGNQLFNGLVGHKHILDSHDKIIRFILLVAPISCLVSSSIGTSTLYVRDLITTENFAFSWLTWWVGDTIGVLLFCPLALVNLSNKLEYNTSKKLYVTIPTSALFIGVLVIFIYSMHERKSTLQGEINENAGRFFYSLEENLETSIRMLSSFAGLFIASQQVEKTEFELFAQNILAGDKVFHGIGWTEIVARDQRKTYESKFKEAGFNSYTFTEIGKDGELVPALQRDYYYPVLYIYPFKRNARAFGFNLGSNKERLKALEQAKATKRPIATAPIKLVQETGTEQGTILYYPVYRPSKATDDNQPFLGFVSGVIKASGVIGNLLQQAESAHYGINIRDVTESSGPVSLITSGYAHNANYSPVRKTIDFGERKIEFEFFANDEFKVFTRDWNSFVILTIGLIIVSLIQAFILLIVGHTIAIQKEVKRKTQALIKAKVDAESANLAKSQFTANISHEIRTPLNAIIGLVNRCLKTSLNSKQKSLLNNVALASESLMSLLNSTLDFSKIEANQFELEYQPFELTHLLKKLYAIFNQNAKDKGLDFTISVPDSFVSNLIGDATRLEQVLINLYGNAFKFTETGFIRLELQTEAKGSNSVCYKFIVRDSGVGIEMDKQAFLFDAFRQADSSTNRKFGGTGLGLTISKSLIELMGGSIGFNSEPGKGSEFFFTVSFDLASPAERIKAEDFNQDILALNNSHLEQLAEPDETNQAKHSLADFRILIVEDIELNRIVVEEILKEYGAKIYSARNGRECIEQLQRDSNFSLILMDLQMPEMDGFEASSIIFSSPDWSRIPIVAMTANVMKEDIEKCLSMGMSGHVAKPIDEKLLIATLLQILA